MKKNSILLIDLKMDFYLVTGLQYLGTNKIRFRNVTSSFSVAQYSNGMPGSITSGRTKTNPGQVIQSVNFNLGIELPS